MTGSRASGSGSGSGTGMSDMPVTWVVQSLKTGASSVPAAARTLAKTAVWGGRSLAVKVVPVVNGTPSNDTVSASSHISSVLACTT